MGRRIQGELDEADLVIVLISPYFVGSAYCGLKELLVALDGGRGRTPRGSCRSCATTSIWAPCRSRICNALPQDEQNDLKPLVDWPNHNVPLAAIAADDPGNRAGAGARALDDG